jgi:hypothetical protein
MKIIAVSILCLAFLSSYSQDTVLVFNKKFRQGTLPKAYKAFATVDPVAGDLHLTLVDNKTIDRYIIDSNWKIKNQFSVNRDIYGDFPYRRFDDMRLFSDTEKEFNIYAEDDGFKINAIDFNEKKEAAATHLGFTKHELIASYFVTANIFCLISADKKSSMLHFITNAKNGGIAFDTINVELKLPGKDMSAAKNMNDVAIVRLGKYDLGRLATSNKIYYSGAIVYLVNDREDATYITKVNLLTGEVIRKSFKQQVVPGKTPAKVNSFNSFFYRNVLVNGNVCNYNTLTISFYDYEKENLIKTYSIHNTDTISFKNGPVLNRKDKEVKKTNSIIDDAETGLAFILDNKGSNEMELAVKTYHQQVASPGGGGFVGMPGSMATPMGSIATTSMVFVSSGGGGASGVILDSHFKCLFEPGTFEHIQERNAGIKSAAEQIHDEIENKDAPETIVSFIKNKNFYIGFYDADSGHYIIKRILTL